MINYQQVLENYPWLIEPNKNAIISYDTDGWVTGVLLTEMLGWNIVGYYDSERLIIKNGVRTDDCAFIDVEIFRNSKKSFGHHLIVYDFDNLPADFDVRTAQCFNPNFYRRFDKRRSYTRKYPLATYHLYDKILRHANIGAFDFNTEDALSVVWFIDGLMNILYKYSGNVREWIAFLQMENEPWYLQTNNRSEADIKRIAQTFITAVSAIAPYASLKNLDNFNAAHLSALITLISTRLGITPKLQNWCRSDYSVIRYNRTFLDLNTQGDFNTFWARNPFSMSTYFQSKISYTLESPYLLP